MSLKIGTHSGSFHADEALAVYMLKLLPKFANAQVVRSRNEEILNECDIVVDVSGRYEPPKYFDHHQREFTTTFGDEYTTTKLSSAGLIYKHFGREVIAQIIGADVNDKVVETIYPRIYESFIEAVDGYDNGVDPYGDNVEPRFKTYSNTLRAVVSNLNPLWTESSADEAFDKNFVEASKLMGTAFEAEVRSKGLGWYPARDAVISAFEKRKEYDPEGRILVFDTYVPWSGHLFDLEKEYQDITYVLYPAGDSVRISAVPVSQGSFESRKALPEAWRGLRDDKLSEVTGIPGGVFVHAAGFIGGNKTREGALEMTRKALNA